MYTVDELKSVGGNEWRKNEMHRVYFEGLPGWLGLHADHYKTGNISHATLNGQEISNSQAKKIADRFMWSKVWFDMTDGKFHGKNINQDDFDAIVSNIKTAIEVKK